MALSLYALVLHLHPLAAGRLEATVGYRAYAAFLQAVQEADPAVSARLHEGQRRRPFTVSPLFGLERDGHGSAMVRPEHSYRLRLTLLEPVLYEELMGRFLSGAQRTIRLGSIEFAIRRVCATAQGDPEAGASSPEQLWEEARPRRGLGLRFVTSTAFNRSEGKERRRFLLFPEPAVVFEGLAGSWNRLGGRVIDREAIGAYARDHVVVAEYDLHTQAWRFEHATQLGFAGRVRYECRGDEAMRRQVAALAALSFYTGAGSKTTQGMGQVRPSWSDE
ncbi:MAG TPA: CRISPR system precrRNA processing endoribonuclease RAMP protein Cas6 [Ardenticatenaceae bacterium]|nr:CRISPR system precrRNA processing endoribonuclease RAMP protein Cas6 [Ardenticatenaceae bacterium]